MNTKKTTKSGSSASTCSAFGVITRNRAEAAYMLEWCYEKAWRPPALTVESIVSFPYVVCLDFEHENAAWTDSLDRAMDYKEFSEFIEQNAEAEASPR